MQETTGDLWRFHETGHWIAIPTNGTLRQDGQLVMGAGVAKQARDRFAMLPLLLGDLIRCFGNQVVAVSSLRIAAFPTKHDWRASACPGLIAKSCIELGRYLTQFEIAKIYLPRVGAGLGGLEWEQVRALIAPLLDDRITIVEYPHAA